MEIDPKRKERFYIQSSIKRMTYIAIFFPAQNIESHLKMHQQNIHIVPSKPYYNSHVFYSIHFMIEFYYMSKE